jgi:hypothetical protein
MDRGGGLMPLYGAYVYFEVHADNYDEAEMVIDAIQGEALSRIDVVKAMTDELGTVKDR